MAWLVCTGRRASYLLPYYWPDAHRHLLSAISPDLHLPDILGTHKGIMALAKFISLTGAFTKTGDTLVDGPDEEEEKAPANDDDDDE